MPLRHFVLVSLIGIAGTVHAQDRATLTVDAVELIGGQEVKGKAEWSTERDGFTYLFSTEHNKTVFMTEPEKYEVQWGGACARMGPLSGKGSSELFTVRDGRLYLFASAACRKAFLAGPDKFLEKVDAPPVATPEATAKGLALLDKAAAAEDGAKRIDQIKSLRLVKEGTAKNKDEEVKTSYTESLEFPGKAKRWTVWDTWSWGEVLTPNRAFFLMSTGPKEMVESQREILEREVSRNPVMVVRSRRQKDVSEASLGREDWEGQLWRW